MRIALAHKLGFQERREQLHIASGIVLFPERAVGSIRLFSVPQERYPFEGRAEKLASLRALNGQNPLSRRDQNPGVLKGFREQELSVKPYGVPVVRALAFLR